jgi:hypothetical protein
MRGLYTFITTLLTGGEYYCYYYLLVCSAQNEYRRIINKAPKLFVPDAVEAG